MVRRQCCNARVVTNRGRVLIFALLALSACDEQIVHDLSEREANKVVSQLHEARVTADKVPQADGRWTIAVAKSDMFAALAVLESQRVLPAPANRSASIGKGGLISSREEQLFHYERAVAQSIEESLTALPGVLEARVHLNLPPQDPLFGKSRTAAGTGSVLLVVDERCNASDDEVSAVVSGAAGLIPGAVKVLRSKAISAVPPGLATPVVVLPPPTEAPVRKPFPATLAVCALLSVAVVIQGARFLRRRRPRVRFALPSGSLAGGE